MFALQVPTRARRRSRSGSPRRPSPALTSAGRIVRDARRAGTRALLALIALALLGQPYASQAQIAPATAGLSERTVYDPEAVIQTLLTSIHEHSKTAVATDSDVVRDGANAVASAALDALMKVRTEEFPAKWEFYQSKVKAFMDACTPERDCAELQKLAGAIPPQVRALQPGVVFGVGVSLTVAQMKTDALVGDFAFSTNLLGAGAAKIIGIFGAGDFGNYLKKNIGVGSSFPVSGRSKRLSAFVEIGMGQILISKFTFWPVVRVEQFDNADVRVPRQLRQTQSDVDRWSKPIFALGFAFSRPDKLTGDISKFKPVPVITLAISFPYYFPGDPFSSLVALLGADFAKYEKIDDVSLSLGVALPLMAVGIEQK